jgi:predicted ATPase
MALRRVFVVPPVRGFETTSYQLEPAPLVDFFEQRNSDLQASKVLSTIAYRRELEMAISNLSEEVLGVRLRIKLIPDKRVSAEADDGSSTNLVNEGFGANQLMILLAQLVVAPPRSLVGLEEVEVHLHPLAQARLADVLVEVSAQDERQIILTTHSEHVVMGLLTRVAQGGLAPSELAVYYFTKEAGVARAERLDVDEHGRLSGGMKGFFEANVDQLDSYLEALSSGPAR